MYAGVWSGHIGLMPIVNIFPSGIFSDILFGVLEVAYRKPQRYKSILRIVAS